MEKILYIFVRIFLAIVSFIPIAAVARLGRFFGMLAYFIDSKHRKTAISNLAAVFPEKTSRQIHALAYENFKRIGENFLCAAKTFTMKKEKLQKRVEFVGIEKLEAAANLAENGNVVAAIGHFGNFELYARFWEFTSGLKCATTYRSLKHKSFDNLLQMLREKTGCHYFERRTEADKLRKFMQSGRVVLGLLSDQHAGDKGVRVPFFGRDCSTSAAPALFAQRYKARLFTAICYRTAPAKWRIEIGEEIPVLLNGQHRDIKDICIDINRAFEKAVIRDPANWFWVHNRWKPPPNKTLPKPQSLAYEQRPG